MLLCSYYTWMCNGLLCHEYCPLQNVFLQRAEISNWYAVAHSVTVVSFGNRLRRAISVCPLPGCSSTFDEMPACFEIVLWSLHLLIQSWRWSVAVQVITMFFKWIIFSGFVMVGVVMFRNALCRKGCILLLYVQHSCFLVDSHLLLLPPSDSSMPIFVL